LFAGRDYKIFLLISKLFFVILLISFVWPRRIPKV
jgi:hypothetical protein